MDEFKNCAILLMGRAKAGKDYFAKNFEEYFNLRSLADELKIKYARILNIDIKDLYDSDKKEFHRPGLISLSENVIKPVEGKDCWAKHLLYRYYAMPQQLKKGLLVTDCRYPEEIQYITKNWIKKGPVYLVRIKSPYEIENCGYCIEHLHADYEINNTRESNLKGETEYVLNELRKRIKH